MLQIEENGIVTLRFRGLSGFPELYHGIFGRKGGVSRPPYESLNVGHGIGDDAETVRKNRDLISRALGGNPLFFPRQVHGADVFVLAGEKGDVPPVRPPSADALVTDRKGLLIAVQTADCQPVFLYDPRLRIAAVVHCGWRGSVQNVLGRTVLEMKERFGCRPESLRGAIGPSLGPCCAEFVNFEQEFPRRFWKYRLAGDRFDLWSLSLGQLKEAGIPAEGIEIGGICTRCRTDIFFSYRGEKVTGRFAAVIGFKRQPFGH
jgi:polyphenol oxidase